MRKKLQVSFSGSKPYVQLNPTGGSDFDIINLLAKKFKFLPLFTPDFPSHEMVKKVRCQSVKLSDVHGDPSDQVKPPIDLDLGSSAILLGSG